MRDGWWLATLVAGVVAGEACGTRWPAAFGGALCVVLAGTGLLCGWRRRRAPAAALLGAALGAWRIAGVVSPSLPADDVARWALPATAGVEGVVASDPVVRPDRTVMVLALRRAERGGSTTPAGGLVRLTVRHALDLLPGTAIRADVRLRVPRNFRTPGSFDWVGFLARRDIRVVGLVRGDVTVLAPAPPGPTRWLAVWRRAIGAGIDATAAGDATPILRALVIGDDAGIPSAVRDAFARAGVAHVLSVSGLHLALVVAAVGWLARRAWERSEWLLLRSNVDVVAASAGAVAAVVYGALAGLATPTLRSAVMVVLALGATMLGRRPDPLRALGVTALAIMWCQPGASREAGCQLSFVSVLGLLAGARRVHADRRRGALVREAIRASTVASVVTAPLTAFHFHQVSLIAPVANLAVIPLFGTVVLAPALVGACCVGWWPGLAHGMFAAATTVLRVAVVVVTWAGGWRWSAVDTPMPTAGELIAVYVLVAAPVLPPRRAGMTAVAMAVCFLIVDAGAASRARGLSGRMQLTFLDVGQGDAAVVEWPDGRVVVIDAGGFPGSDFDVGAAVVSPFLAVERIGRIDLAIVTHPHPDHFAGMADVAERRRIDTLWWDGMAAAGSAWERLHRAAERQGVRWERPYPTANVAGWPGLSVLHPSGDWHSPPNDASVVVEVRWRRFAALFTGDAERAAEAAMTSGGALGPVVVLKVPHHGSRTSSTPAFLDRVRPRIAVISAGADNRYGLPAPDVEARYRAFGVCVLRTDRCGAVSVVTDGTHVDTTAVDPSCRCPAVELTPPR